MSDKIENEDEKIEREGREYGKANVAAYCAKFPKALEALIGVYADNAAVVLLDALRDDFWARTWIDRPEWKLSAKAIAAALRPAQPSASRDAPKEKT